MIESPSAGRVRHVRRVVFLPRWHDNPYQELLASGLASLGVQVEIAKGRLLFVAEVLRGGRPDVLHVHTPDYFVVYRRSLPAAVVALGLFVAQLVTLRLLGVTVIWTAHDLLNHERRYPRLDRLCRLATARLSGAVIVHCAGAGRSAAAAFGLDSSRIRVVPHGHYQDRYPDFNGDALAARATLELPADPFIVLFLGNLRRHKGLEPLMDAFQRLDRDGVLLVIAGEPFDDGIRAALTERVAGQGGVRLRLGFVSEDAVAAYLRASDVVVCPFTSSLTSGSLALALSFGKAVVVPRLGCAAEMVSEDGGFLYDPKQPDALVSSLRAAVDARERLEAIGARNRTRMRPFDWTLVARRTLAVYDEAAIG